MTVPGQTLPRMSPDAYLAYERDSESRHERVNGCLYAATGASDRSALIDSRLRQRPKTDDTPVNMRSPATGSCVR